ncbi:MAG TPA: mechanosensitive ion channel family protein [Bacillota bacterium]|nr:mechanosensitive ion channel family protein [Bacillota bacterium]
MEQVNGSQLFVEWGMVLVKLIAIVIIYFIVKSIGQRAIEKAFQRKYKTETRSSSRRRTLQSIVSNVFTYFLLFIIIGIVFELFGLDIKALLAGAGIVGLAIGFGAQGLVSDVVTGFFILLEKQMDVDDYVTVAGYDGIIAEIGLRTTTLRGFDGTLHFIPNREITSVSNHSRGNMRALVDISISYDEDIDQAIKALQQACEEFAEKESAILEGPDVLGVEEMDSANVVIRVICKTKNMEQWNVERKLRKLLKETLANLE